MRELKLNLLEDDVKDFNKSWKKLKKLHKKLMNNIEVSDGLLLHQTIQQKINQYESEIKTKNGTNERRILTNKIISDLGYLDDNELKLLTHNLRCNIYNKIRGRQN